MAVFFLLYAYFGPFLPGFLAHRGYGIADIAEYMYLTTEGLYGIAIGVSSTYIILFIIFGAFLQKSGMGLLFNDIALTLAGSGKGGPAKVAVVSSAFLGSINGSAIANVVTTGAFTIPLMKKIGYEKNFAGAVEAAASCGGQILPPIMGASAFIMAEYLNMQYITIAICAIIPAVLYYCGIMIIVHIRAAKLGLTGLPKEELPRLSVTLKERGHLLIPLLGLVVILIKGYTPIFAATTSIILTIIISFLKKETRMSLKDMSQALENGARTALGVGMACAVVGLIIGVATLTGFGLKLAGIILMLGQGKLFLTLVLTMITCIILGMGLPSIPAYIITATMAAPALTKLGISPLAAHMFVFYFAILANLTPPVALAAFAGAGIAKGDPMQTGFQAVKLASAGFLVPYVFAYSPALLLIDSPWSSTLFFTLTTLLGILALGAALENHLFASLTFPQRIAVFISSFLLIYPGYYISVCGAVILLLALVSNKYGKNLKLKLSVNR